MGRRRKMVDSTRYLNLDEFVPEPLTFTWKKTNYVVESISTEAFLRWSKLQDKAKQAEGSDTKQVELAPEMLCEIVPTFPLDEAKRMELPALWKLVNWIMEHITQDLERLGEETKNLVKAENPSTLLTSSPA